MNLNVITIRTGSNQKISFDKTYFRILWTVLFEILNIVCV